MYDELVKALRCCADDNIPCKSCPRCAQCTKDMNMNSLFPEAADAIEELEFACNRYKKDYKDLCTYLPKWIPTTERLPNDKREVQITVFWHDAWRTMYGYYDGAYWHLYAPMHTEVADVYVIGWMEKPTPMPMPELPKEEA